MSQPFTTQFPMHIRGAGSTDQAHWETLMDALRAELVDVGVTRVEQVPSSPAPDDARGVVSDIAGGLDLVVTAAATAEVLAKIVRTVQRWRERHAQRLQPMTLELAGIELGAGESAVHEIVGRLVAQASQPVGAGGEIARRALVIANLSYDDAALRGLRAPAADARALDRVLRDPHIGGFDVELCLDESEPTIRRRIADFFADRDRDDLLLLHYSGHGLKDSRGRLHLAARDTDLRRLAATAVPASFVNDQMTESASRRVVLVLDCCYSGAFARGALVRADRAVHVAEEFSGQGRVVLTASSATEYAFEGGQLAESDATPSVFTSALVRGLETGAADLDTDGEITIDELYDYTYREVRRNQPGQAPMKWSFGVEGSLVLAHSVRGAELPQSMLDDLRSNRIGLRLEVIGELKRLLRAATPGIREAARHALNELHDHDDSNQVRDAAAQALTTASGSPPLSAETAPPAASAPVQAPPEPAAPAQAPWEPVAIPAPPMPREPRRPLVVPWLRGRWVAVAAVVLVVVAGVAFLVRPLLAGDADSSSPRQGSPTPSTPPGPGPRVEWSAKGPGPITTRPAVDRDRVYFGSGNQIKAVRRDSGKDVWTFRTSAPATYAPQIADTEKLLLAATQDGYLYAIGSDDGQERWRVRVGTRTQSSPRLVAGGVLIGSDDGGLYKFDLAGQQEWRFPTGGPVSNQPTANDELVIFGSQDGNLYAVDGRTGRKRWNADIGPTSAPNLSQSVLLVRGRNQSLYRINPDDGTTIWPFKVGSDQTHPPAMSGPLAYVGGDTALVAVNVSDGVERWQFRIKDGGPLGHPSVSDGVIYIGSEGGRVYAVDTSTGAQRWEFQAGGPVRAAPRTDGGIVYVSSADGTLYSLRPPPVVATPAATSTP